MGPVDELPDGYPDNDMTPIENEPGVFNGVVINIAWSALQATQGATVDTSTIDSALAVVSAYNAEYPQTPLGVRLNVEQALLAPDWAKTLDGPSVINYINGDEVFHVGRFWMADYQAAWTSLQNQLAAIYDTNPLIHEISNTSCSSATGEPFVIRGTPLAITNMQAAGYTDAQYLSCLENSPASYAAWVNTPLHWAFNNFEHLDSGVAVIDQATTNQILQAWRLAKGSMAILANHSLRNGTLNGTPMPEYGTVSQMYGLFTQLGKPINLQSDTALEDWTSTINYGINVGATDIEIWPGTTTGYFQQAVPPDQIMRWGAQLQANANGTTVHCIPGH